ncbi:MAG: RluA family pseudouridine synthase [Bacilli bacterium]|nr:RluA family pseudouridine synthase [Bacilli bacterium]MDD4482346.1 RluA family pseudouridine synthase [Bacilli bacterium]
MKELNFVYEKEEIIRLDKYLVEMIPEESRTNLQNLIKANNVLVNDEVVKANYKLVIGDEIEVIIPDAVSDTVLPEDIPLDIVYEDEDIIVINKVSGLVVHPGAGNKDGTLVNALLFHCKDLSGINGIIRAGIVHRIDKDTSGLLVACKNDLAHRNLAKQFEEKKVTRKYHAICYGVIPHNLGKINAPIARSKTNRQMMGIVERGKNALTNFKVIERYKEHTYLELQLETGRTHQIRVHMKYIGFPILGDPVYGPRNVYGETGQFLHAKTLGFYHPRSNKFMEFDSELPIYFRDFIQEQKKNLL